MPEFTGQYLHTLDPKGRLTLPAPFRDALARERSAMLAIRPNRCLAIHPRAEWSALTARLRQLPANAQEALAYKRVLLASAFECEMDRQGRILIPPALRSLAAIVREVAIVGSQEVVEIWDRQRWTEYFDLMFKSYDQNAGKVHM